MIDHEQLRQYVIRPVLNHLGLHSENAEELLVLTAAVESSGGQYLHQLGKGPACGIYQMEPATHDSLWAHYLRYKADLADKVHDLELPGFLGDDAREMCGNMYYATAMARVFYLAKPGAIPSKNDVRGLAGYWKHHYNTHLGAGTVDKAVQAYLKYIA